MSEKIKVIMCLSEEHGKRIIEYLEGIGGANSHYTGVSVGLFYGIKDGKIRRFTHSGIFSDAYGKIYENFEIIELPESKPISELEELKQQKAEIEKRIEELEKQEPETFEAILEMLDKGEEYESIYVLNKITEHVDLYHKLKRIEHYVNNKFGGKVDWMDQMDKIGFYYDHQNSQIAYDSPSSFLQEYFFYFISYEARNYFIRVTGEHLVNFFKATH